MSDSANDAAKFWEAVGFKVDDPSSLREGEVFLLEHGHRREACQIVRDYDDGFFAVPVANSLLPKGYRVVVMGKPLSLEEMEDD